jgi:hypothetical protein
MKNEIKIFEDSKVRSVWDEENEKWLFSVVDVVGILTDSENPRHYWTVLKGRLKKEGNQSVTNCDQLKMPSADGKFYKTDVADAAQLLRIIQSIPSKKAEPFKMWLANIGSQIIDETVNPELTIDRAVAEYRALGYSENWINQRIKSIEVRKGLTDEWDKSGVNEGKEYAELTDLMSRIWSGFSIKQYKQLKGLKKENLRDNMTNTELILNMLAEVSATEISQAQNPQGFAESRTVAAEGAKTAQVARKQLEKSLGKSVISPLNAKNIQGGQVVIPENTDKRASDNNEYRRIDAEGTYTAKDREFA